MSDSSPSWLSRASDTIRELAERPWALFALLLALNAIARPCTVTAHDARLYSLQVLNQAEHGAYAEDVFLRYGSQDQYSLFSRALAPLVAEFGLRPTFFAFYLVVNSLFVLALMRLVRSLVDDAFLATISLVFLVTAPLAYGGHDIFMVHEQFFTPRTIATTLVLFALERLLRGWYLATFALLLAGLALHPLMAFPGLLIAVGYLLCSWLPPRVFVALVAAAGVGFAAVLAIPAVGCRLFGTMDSDWHAVVRHTVNYNYPDAWTPKDWINTVLSLALPVLACFVLFRDTSSDANGTTAAEEAQRQVERRRFYAIAAIVGLVGFFATLAASLSPYALLFQAQPYRALWILKVLQIPLAFLLIARWKGAPDVGRQLAALGLAGFLCVTHYVSLEFQFMAWMLPLTLGYAYIMERADRRDWWWVGALRGCVLGAVLWAIFRWTFFLSHHEMTAAFFDLHEWVLFDMIGPVVCLVVFVAGAARLGSVTFGHAVRFSAVSLAMIVPVAFYAAEVSREFQRDHTRLGRDIQFLQQFVNERRTDPGHRPAIYSALGRPESLWIDVRATSYFDTLQTAGVIFNRQNALEMQRRTTVVKKFEFERYRPLLPTLGRDKKAAIESALNLRFDQDTTPTVEDLARLCDEPGLDYVVLEQAFPGLYTATNGHVYVYECKTRRASGEAVGLATRR